MDLKTRKQLAVKRGIKITLADFVKQLLAAGDAVSIEAAGLLVLASSRISREQAHYAAVERRRELA